MSTTAVLLGQVDGEFVDDISSVAAQGAEESAVSVHDDEAEGLVGFEEFAESFGVEFVVAQVEGGIDGLEGLEVDVDFSFFAFRCDDFSAVDDQSIRGDFIVQLETLLGGCDG